MSSLKKIYTADYSAEGYADGMRDAKKAEPKQYFGALRIHPANYLWQYSNAHDSYCSSYDKGYLDGQRVAHDMFSSHAGGGMTELERQYQQLEQTKNAVYQHKSQLEQACEHYGRQVFAMKSAGFVDDYTIPLHEKYQALKQKVEEMQAELDRQILLIQQFQDSLRNMSIDARSSAY